MYIRRTRAVCKITAVRGGFRWALWTDEAKSGKRPQKIAALAGPSVETEREADTRCRELAAHGRYRIVRTEWASALYPEA